MNKNFKRIPNLFALLITFILLTLPTRAGAHVKWFSHTAYPVESYHFSNAPVILAIILGSLLLCLGWVLEKKLQTPKKLLTFIATAAPGIKIAARIGFGLAFILFAYQGFIFAPNLVAIGFIGKILLLSQFSAGLMILFGLYKRTAGFLILLIFTSGIAHFGFLEMIDTLEMVGIGLYFVLTEKPVWKTQNLSEHALPLLRIFTGLNLMVLGFTEKILSPGLALNFLSHYQWNFMQRLGFVQYTDYWFAFSAGVVEFLFGLFLALGLITRLTTLTLAVFLGTTLVLLGPIELLGHLPHFSIALLLLTFGSKRIPKIEALAS